MTSNAKFSGTVAAVVFMLSSPVLAQSTNDDSSNEPGSTPDQTKSGYTVTSVLESGDSVVDDLAQDDIKTGSAFSFPGEPLKPWFDTKRRWNEKYGLKLQFSYQSLYQKAAANQGPTTLEFNPSRCRLVLATAREDKAASGRAPRGPVPAPRA